MKQGINSSYPSREYFERASSLLKEIIENKHLKITERSSMMIEQLGKVEKCPNGRLNLLTVDELVRTQLLMMNSNILDTLYKNPKSIHKSDDNK